jgi:CHAT domain-containing protein/tetratricopeptide (TPR) repeat protein
MASLLGCFPLLILLLTGPAAEKILSQDAPPRQRAAVDLEKERAEFNRLDRTRQEADDGSRARAEAAEQATRQAAVIAWELYRLRQWTEAGSWLERQVALRRESYAIWSTLLDADSKRIVDTVVAASDKNIDWAEFGRLALTASETAGRAIKTPQDPAALAAQAEALEKGSVLLSLVAANGAFTQNRNAAGMLAGRQRDRTRELVAAAEGVEWARLWKTVSAQTPAVQRPLALAAALETLGTVETKLGDYAAAQQHLQEALEIRRAAPATNIERQLQDPLYKLALIEQELGRPHRARELLNEALAAARATPAVDPATASIGDVIAHANGAHPWNIQLALASVLEAEGHYAEAMAQVAEAQREARALVETVEQMVKRAPALRPLLAQVAKVPLLARPSELLLRARLGDSKQARSDLRVLVRELVSADPGNAVAAAALLVRLATLDASLGQPDAALESLRQAQQYFVAEGETEPIVAAELGLASVLERSGENGAASTHAATALRLARQAQLGRWTGRAATAALRLELGRASAPAKAKATTIKPASAATRGGGTAAASVEDLLALIGTNFNLLTPEEQAAALVAHGRADEARGDATSAAVRYEQAVDRLEVLRVDPLAQDAFYDTGARYEPYEHLVALAAARGDAEGALAQLFRSRRKELLQAHDPSNFASARPELQQPLERLRALHARIQTLSASVARMRSARLADAAPLRKQEEGLQSAIAEWRSAGEEITRIEPAYRAYVGGAAPSLADVRRRLPPGTALVVYMAPLDAALHILVITHDQATFHRSPMAPQQIWKVTGEALDAISSASRPRGSGQAALAALHSALIAPIAPRLAGIERLAILPTRRLHYLPFGALATRTAKGIQYLIEDKEVVYVSGAAIAGLTTDASTTAGAVPRVALFGNATGDLPGAEREVSAIEKIFPAAGRFVRAAATPDAVRTAAAEATVLHFAVHGQIGEGLPTSSHLRLAPDTAAGNLTVGEIRTLPAVNASLVTLSACVSALGQGDPRGVAASSLSDAFLAAGADTVVGTLWRVHDDSTRDLMVGFYKALAGGTCKGAALRSAQLAMLRSAKWSAPYHWSAFQLAGDFGALSGSSASCPILPR